MILLNIVRLVACFAAMTFACIIPNTCIGGFIMGMCIIYLLCILILIAGEIGGIKP